MEILILCFLIFGISSAAKLPSYITPCHQSDPRLNECIIRAMEDVRPHLKGGIPEFQLPSMNPLILPQATLDTGANFKATFKNIEVYYIDEFNFKRVNIDLKNNFVDMVLGFSRLRIKSIYNIQGRLLVLQLNGNGPADGNFTNAEVSVTMRGPRLTKNGKQYFKFNQNKLNLKFGRSSMRFDNLFENNEELNMQTNRAINENIDNIIEELRPVLTEVIGKFIFGLIASYITLCKRTDPELDKCILRAVEQIKPHLKKGIPELGIPSLDPLVVPYAGISTGPDFNASFENIEVYNVHEFDLKKFAVDLDKIHLDIEISIPNLRTKSKYSVNGKILFLELKGSGPSEGNFTNIRATVTGNGKKVERQGKSYIEINEVKVDANYGKPVLVFSELFENKEVTEQTNKVINDNVESLIEELKPVINQVVTEIVQNLSSRVFAKFSFDELFPM